MASKVVLKLEGFDELLNQIEKAGGNINNSVDTCMRESAKIMETELKKQMQTDGVDAELINSMPAPKVQWQANSCQAEVGYSKGTYDPNNLSDGYKVVFLNYGTPNRSKHGKMEAKGFIARAKKKANSQIKKKQKETLENILGELDK